MANRLPDDQEQQGNSGQESVDKDTSFLITSYLDEMESRIDGLRHQALSLSQEKDSLLTILSDLKADCSKDIGGNCNIKLFVFQNSHFMLYIQSNTGFTV